MTSRVLQATCSPVRNPLDKRERRALRSAFTRPVVGLRPAARARGRGAGPGMRWSFAQAPTFDNQIARLDLCGRDAQLCIEKTLPAGLAGAAVAHEPVAGDRAEGPAVSAAGAAMASWHVDATVAPM